ncbi:MAG: anhydro-N-acetylmuramic acid kinase [Gemmatimonadota bacterium]
MNYVGLMSGTSLDGIDAVLVDLEGTAADLRWHVRAFRSDPWSVEERARIAAATETGTPASLCRLHVDLGEAFARATLALLDEAGVDPSDVAAIGSHGQTVWHEPPTAERRGATLQLGDPATLAERTGIPVVSDLRARDVAAGGHGAPLVCFADRLLLAADGGRAVQNLGGMGNVTWIPPRRDARHDLLAFDTGPGNALIDAAVELASAGRATYDRDGRRAARGHVDASLLDELMSHPFFATEPPRSTGREVFGRPYVQALAERLQPTDVQAWDDLVATLTALTARSVGDALRRWVLPRGVDDLVLVGGGAHNPTLVAAIASALAPLPVVPARAVGMDPDAREAIGFAVLAWAFQNVVAGNEVGATGAAGPRLLGSWTPGRALR